MVLTSTFDGYFLKVVVNGSDVNIPNKFISLQSYVSTPHQRQDLDSFRDNNGVLHRNALKHYVSKVEFNTPIMYEDDLIVLQNLLNSAIINETERKITIKHYCFDTHQYESTTAYMPDITFTPYRIEKVGNTTKVLMDKVRLAFIEY